MIHAVSQLIKPISFTAAVSAAITMAPSYATCTVHRILESIPTNECPSMKETKCITILSLSFAITTAAVTTLATVVFCCCNRRFRVV